jgi:hypothetical protein
LVIRLAAEKSLMPLPILKTWLGWRMNHAWSALKFGMAKPAMRAFVAQKIQKTNFHFRRLYNICFIEYKFHDPTRYPVWLFIIKPSECNYHSRKWTIRTLKRGRQISPFPDRRRHWKFNLFRGDCW